MSKTEDLNKLFGEWRPKYGDGNFAEDGIVDEALWDKAKKKVLFILKDTNKCPGDFREKVNNKPWRMLGYWAYGLQNTDSERVVALRDASNKSNYMKACRASAIINLKKSPGGAQSDAKRLEQAAKNDSDLIKKEYNIIQPDIVVCGGTIDICKKIWPLDDTMLIGPDRFCYKFQKAIWFKYCHPSLPGVYHVIKYYGLMVLYQNILQQKKSNFLSIQAEE